MTDIAIYSDPNDPTLTKSISGLNERAEPIITTVTVEKPLTLYLNSREIVTLMTTGDHLNALAIGYLINQGMLSEDNPVIEIEYDADLQVIVVRTANPSDYEQKLRRLTRTSGCAMGAAFTDLLEAVEGVKVAPIEFRISWLHDLVKTVNTLPSLYLKAGGIHGCALCLRGKVLIFLEDIGRHNAVDKVAGYMRLNKICSEDKVFYTTGRLTSEMIIKTIKMGIPVLISRSGFTAWGVELARKAGLTLIGRARGKRFNILSGQKNVKFDVD